jgi:hypothetical protein
VASSERDASLTLHHPGGAVIVGGKIDLPADVRAVTAHPSGKGLLVLVAQHEERLGYVEVDAAFRPSAPVWLDDVEVEAPWVCATSLAEGIAFLVATDSEGASDLYAFRAGSGALETLYRARLPARVSLVLDPLSRRVFALSAGHERASLTPLGEAPPSLPAPAPRVPRLPGLDLWLGCDRATSASDDLVLRRLGEFRGRPEASVLDQVRRQLDSATGSLADVLDTHTALGAAGHRKAAREVLAWLGEHRPSDPHAALLLAADAARAGRWAEVRARLEGVDPGAVVEERRQHVYHLLALAFALTRSPLLRSSLR